MDTSALKILWICSWFPNDEDRFRGDFIERQAAALAGKINFELLHFVDQASKNEENVSRLAGGCKVTIGYSKTKNKLLSFKKQWSFYNRYLKDYVKRNGRPDIIHVHIPWKAGLVARYWLKKYKIPYIISEHYGIYNNRTEDNFFKKSKFVKRYNKKIFESASQVITVSKSLGEEIKSIFKVDYKTIPNVVNTENFYFKNITLRKEFALLHISNMYNIKNTDKIVEAFALAHKKDASLRLKLVGAKPIEIEKQIEKLDCKHAIDLLGEVSYEQVSEVMKAHHVFVLFSDWETQSCVALEALCSGRPVITSAVGGVQELITPQNGLLVAPRNVTELAHAMQTLKNNFDQYHLEQIALNAQEKFSYNKVAQQILESYQQVLAP